LVIVNQVRRLLSCTKLDYSILQLCSASALTTLRAAHGSHLGQAERVDLIETAAKCGRCVPLILSAMLFFEAGPDVCYEEIVQGVLREICDKNFLLARSLRI
jgi:hypothetical protein